MSKNLPKRVGEIVDQILAEAGVRQRLVPRSVALQKSEATTLLQFVRLLREQERKRMEDVQELARLAASRKDGK